MTQPIVEVIEKDGRRIFMIDIGDMDSEVALAFIQTLIKKFKETKGV